MLFLVAVNTGSLKASPEQILRGLFVAYDETVATIYSLRFPRILIAMLAGRVGSCIRCHASGGNEKSAGRSGNHGN